MKNRPRNSTRRHRWLSERGSMLLETMFASGVMLVGVLGTFTLVDGANDRTVSTKAREGATALGRQVVEATRSIPYPQLTPSSIESQLQSQPGLEDQSATSGWTVRRRGFTYEIDATVCTYDDGADGGGGHDVGSFCSDSTAGSGDASPDDYKRVVVELTWDAGHGEKKMRQAALVNNPGNSVGPAVRTLQANAPLPIETNFAEIGFTATTSTAPATVRWSVEGVPRGTATGSGTNWSFSWDISDVLDGSYLVGAQALDAGGGSGNSKAVTVTLNRFVPAAPQGFAAGRNGTAVDIEWQPNEEGDIVGYRVYRLSGSVPELVCSTTTETVCRDNSPPNAEVVSYWAVALDRGHDGSHREGLSSEVVQVTKTNNPPNAPTNLQLVTGTDGTATLTWQAPDQDDPDEGDSIEFYRVYRDGTAYEDRYDRTGLGTDLTYVDPAHNGETHTYWVTAVDSQLAESVVLGPVEG